MRTSNLLINIKFRIALFTLSIVLGVQVAGLQSADAQAELSGSIPPSAGSQKGCACPTKVTLEEAFEKSSLVFQGQIKQRGKNPLKPDFQEFKVTVTRKLKGFEELGSNTILVYTPIRDEDCSYPFNEGLDYLIFATGFPAFYKVTSCSRTELLERATVDVQKAIRLSTQEEAQ